MTDFNKIMQDYFQDDPSHWRMHAEEARTKAEHMRSPSAKEQTMKIAECYEGLAKLAEEKLDTLLANSRK